MRNTQPEPILRVTVGSPIYTSDDQKIGTVKDLRGNAIKVSTPILQRDFWLTGRVVAEALPDAPVILSVDRAHLAEHRIDEPGED